MSPIDHAAAHERIEDLLLEPARLRSLTTSTAPEDVALREHVAGCATCRADLESWTRLQRRLGESLPASSDEARAATQPIEAPPSMRAAVVQAARTSGGADRRTPAPTMVLPAAGSRRRRPVVAWLAVAASIVVLAGAGLLAVDQARQRDAAESDARALASVVAAVDRVLVAPRHWVVPLRTEAGGAGGSISWSSQDLVVLTTVLQPPPAGQRYRCWLVEGDADATAIGTMFFAGRTAYWVGSLDEWATIRIGPNTRFAVTLEPVDGSRLSGPIVLSADLGA
jgi:Anti-sigma-K factor rskA